MLGTLVEALLRACLAMGWTITALLAAFAGVQAIARLERWPEPLTLDARDVIFADAFGQVTVPAAAVCVAVWSAARLVARYGRH